MGFRPEARGFLRGAFETPRAQLHPGPLKPQSLRMGPGHRLDFKSSLGDSNVQAGSRGIIVISFTKMERDRFPPGAQCVFEVAPWTQQKIQNVQQKLIFSLDTVGSLNSKEWQEIWCPGQEYYRES